MEDPASCRIPKRHFLREDQEGLAVLMDMDYMADMHFPEVYKHVGSLNRLAQYINDKISAEPWDTTTLRKTAMQEFSCTKSQFDTALKNLQITMNIVRLIEKGIECGGQ
jgi:hypothetical protein